MQFFIYSEFLLIFMSYSKLIKINVMSKLLQLKNSNCNSERIISLKIF